MFNERRKSREIIEKSIRYMPGGVNSPVRSFGSVGGDPPVFAKGKASRLFDVDGNSYIDWVASWGPLILGHAHPEVLEAIHGAAEDGTSFGAPTLRELQLAELICETLPSVEKVRMVSSGTEATMSAIRLARAFTGRDDILKFDGGFHGHADSLLVKAGSGVETFGLPDSPGVPAALARHTATLSFNDFEAVEDYFNRRGDKTACIILEPVMGNMGCIPPEDGFLGFLREICDKSGSLLLFDEVMTAYRVSPGGAQELYGVMPDLTALGKVIGGGLPVGAYGGRADIMKMVAPEGPVYQAGTLSGNPLAMASGIATLEILRREGSYEKIEKTASLLERGLNEIIEKAGAEALVQRVGSMLALYFRKEAVKNADDARSPDPEKFSRFHRAMLDRGIYLPPSRVESWFAGLAHEEKDVEDTLAAVGEALSEC